jgi:hypothetical protein
MPEHDQDDDRDPDGGAHAEELGLRDRRKRWLIGENDEVAAGHAAADPAHDKRHREGGDERVDAEERADDSVREPDDDADQEAHNDGDNDTVRQRDLRGDDTRQRIGRTDREVDSAADEHEGTGGRDDQRGGLLVEDVQ